MNIIDQLCDEIRGYKKSRTISTALHFGFLSTIRACGNDVSLDELGSKLPVSVSDDWLKAILNVLASIGIIEEYEGRYHLTDVGIDVDNNSDLRSFASYHYYCFESWQKLPEALVSGKPGGFHHHRLAEKAFCHAYLMSMDRISISNMSFLEKECKRFLKGNIFDIGAGPASLCRHLANQDRTMYVTAIDLPEMISTAQELFSVPENFEWVAADFLDWTPHNTSDAVFCSHLLEYSSPNRCFHWLYKLRSFLRKGGYLVLVMFLRGHVSQDNLNLNLFEISTGLNGIQLGHIQTQEGIQSLLIESGFNVTKIKPIPRGPSYTEFLVISQL